jgi:hypothetical protein
MRLSTLGLVSVLAGTIAVAPAFAETPGSISGSATLVTPAGFTSTVSGEAILPTGFFYNTGSAAISQPITPPLADPNATLTNAAVIVVPTYTVAGSATFVTNTLSVGSSAAPEAVPAGTSFSATAASILANSAAAVAGPGGSIVGLVYNSSNIEFITAIISAGAGVNGLD